MVIEGRDLAVKDLNGFSDPYCLITVSGAKAGNKIRTKTVNKSLNPVWNEKYEFDLIDPTGVIHVEVWDEDFLTPDDFMGQLDIPISSIAVGQVVDRWYKLEKRKAKDKISGEIHISFQLTGPKAQKDLTPDDFEFLAVLGKGTFGKVFQVRKRDNGKIYAMKVLKKSYIIKQKEVEHTLAERSILKSVKHPFMVNMRFSFQTERKLYIVLDYVNGGELFYHLQKAKRFDEERARFYAAEVVLVIEYLHSRGIIYRFRVCGDSTDDCSDLKPENLLLEDTGHVRVTDFGLSKEGLLSHSDRTNTFCGTPAYLAPEVVLQRPYGKEIDWWSLGNLIYEMMTGLPPFYNPAQPDVQSMYRRILHGEFSFPSYISPTARSIMQALLTVDPKERLGYNDDANAIKAHPFFAGIDWDRLLAKEVTPPFIPKVHGEADYSNFDTTFTSERPVDNDPAGPVSPADQAKFREFDHVDPSEAVKMEEAKPAPAPVPQLSMDQDPVVSSDTSASGADGKKPKDKDKEKKKDKDKEGKESAPSKSLSPS